MPTLQNGEKKLKDLRESNIALVINLMRKFGICSRAELSKASGLVQSTITSIIDSLIKAGIVIETGSLVGGRGRRSIGIRLNTEKLIVLLYLSNYRYFWRTKKFREAFHHKGLRGSQCV